MDKKHTQIKQKRVFLLVIIALIAMLLCLPGTLAAFLADTKAQNHIDFGGVNLKIIQTKPYYSSKEYGLAPALCSYTASIQRHR